MPDPASWLVVDRGWDVVDADGNHVGKVEEIVGDSTRDIFNGITVATGLFARGHYVAAEDVAEAVHFLARSDYTTGQVVVVDGGLTLT